MPIGKDTLKALQDFKTYGENTVVGMLRGLRQEVNQSLPVTLGMNTDEQSANTPLGVGFPRLYTDGLFTASGNTVSYKPSDGKLISIYVDTDGNGKSEWVTRPFEDTLTADTTGFTNNRLYDWFLNDDITNGLSLVALAWTNETTRATALTAQDGALLRSDDLTQRYIGTGRYNGSTMLLPSMNPNGELLFGTGDPRNNVADPFSGVGMSAGGVTFGAYVWQFFAAAAGVVGVGFNAAGQLLFGAGKGLLSVLGMILTADVYPSSAYIKWLSADTAVSIGELIATYAGAVVNSGLLVYGQAHDDAVRGFVQIGAKDDTGTVKATFTVDTNGDITADNMAALAGSFLLKTKSASTNVLKEIFSLYAKTTGTAAVGFGTAIGFYADDAGGSDQQIGYVGFRYTDPTEGSEDTEFVIARRVAGVDTGTALSGFIYTLLDDANAAAARTTLGVAIGSNVQAWDADLDYLASFTPTANVKSILNAADYAAIRTLLGVWTTVNKVTTETITSDNTLNNDAELIFAVAASTKYAIRGKIFFDTSAAADFKYRTNNSGTTTLVRGRISHVIPGTTADVPLIETAMPTTTVSPVGTGTTGGYIEIDMILHVNGAGNFIFQWSQATSDASNTSVLAGSYLEYKVIA